MYWGYAIVNSMNGASGCFAGCVTGFGPGAEVLGGSEDGTLGDGGGT